MEADSVCQRSQTQCKQEECNPHNRSDVLCLLGDDLEENPSDHSEHDSVCDGIGERHHDDGHETAGRVGNVGVEVHVFNRGQHQKTNVYQRRSGSESRNRQEDWREEQGNQEQHAGNHCGETGSSAGSNTCGGLYVTGYGRSTEASTQDGTECIGEQSTFRARQVSVLVQQAALGSYADQGSNGIEQVNE